MIRILKESETKREAIFAREDPVANVEEPVRAIIEEVRKHGDEALKRYTKEFDGADIPTVEVGMGSVEDGFRQADPVLVEILFRAVDRIAAFHQHQLRNSFIVNNEDGIILGQKITPIEVSGCYVPGGRAVYPSSVLMNIVPAKVAGVEKIIMVTPPGPDGKVPAGSVVAADIAGATEIYKAGGAQAIAAMAYGTETIPKADKITGPGNIYVALAKKACFGVTGIDSVAGPSEILVIADETANARFVAADLLSQAEHDPMASAILLTTSRELAEAVSQEIDAFLRKLSRAGIIRESLDQYGYIFVGDTMEDLVEAANTIASEHLEIVTADPFSVMTGIRNAGAIFLGSYSSEPLGDYFAGPNHILPTNGTARFFSPLGVDQFIKRTSIISYSKQALEKVHEDIELFAMNEGLDAHANSIRVRFE